MIRYKDVLMLFLIARLSVELLETMKLYYVLLCMKFFNRFGHGEFLTILPLILNTISLYLLHF